MHIRVAAIAAMYHLNLAVKRLQKAFAATAQSALGKVP